MAGRFLLQKLSTGIFRSASRLGSHASACARAEAPVARTAPVARYFNTVPLSCTDAKASRPATGIPSVIINRVKPAYMNSVNGARSNFSSGASNKFYSFSPETDIEAYCAALDRNTTTIVVLSTLIAIMWFYPTDGHKSSNNGRVSSRHCPGCNCVAAINSRHCPGCNCVAADGSKKRKLLM